jgi:hypothetical protein
LWYNGVEVASNSRLIIDEVSDNISVTLRPGNSGFFDIIKTLKLREFNLPEFDHVWNRAYIVANKDNIWSDGVCYPVIDTGNMPTLYPIVLTKGLIGGMFMKYLLNRIASFYGYTMVFPTDTLMNELFLPISNQQVGERLSNDIRWIAVKPTQTLTMVVTQVQTFELDFEVSTQWGDRFNYYDNVQYGYPIIRIPYRGTYRGFVSFDITLASTSGATLRLMRTFGESSIILGLVAISGSYSFDFDFSLDTYSEANLDILFAPAVWLELELIDFTVLASATITNLVFQCTENDLPETNYNRAISMQHNLPDITVGQLFIEFGNITGSYFDVNDISGNINVVRLNDVFDAKANPNEWQPKIDTAKQQVIRYSIPGFGKQNVFRWADDSEKNYIVECDNELLPDTVNIINSGFNIGFERSWANNILLTALYNVYDFENNRIKLNVSQKPIVIRIIPTTLTVNFAESNINSGNITNFNIGVFRELDWLTLYNKRYEPIIGGIIDRMLYVEIFFTIDELDLIDFDFERPIYLQDPNGYFYVQRISEFTGRDESTKFIMIKI